MTNTDTVTNVVDQIVRYENDEMTPAEEIQFFSDLIQTGVIGHLQGHYSRRAYGLVDAGLLDLNGQVI